MSVKKYMTYFVLWIIYNHYYFCKFMVDMPPYLLDPSLPSCHMLFSFRLRRETSKIINEDHATRLRAAYENIIYHEDGVSSYT